MPISYLNKKWEEITREERYFCAELFYEIKNDLQKDKEFLKHLKKEGLKIDLAQEWDVGFEVCFYRDFLWNPKVSGGRESGFSLKRTFDLVLFSESAFIIIEAKAFEGFVNKQLSSFDEDRNDVRKAIELMGKKSPQIYILALASSNYIKNMKEDTKKHFDLVIGWDEMTRLFKNTVFQRANFERKHK